MAAVTSADPDDLDGFVRRAGAARRSLAEDHRGLVSQYNAVVAASPDFAVSSSVLSAAGAILSGLEQNEGFVDTVADTLRSADRTRAPGPVTVSSARTRSSTSRVRTNGDVVRWHPGSNTFGVMDAGGAPRTFFRPDPSAHKYANNWDYFYAQ